jgi:hypothetical protein
MAYNGHRGPNVSEFIANLNAIPPAQELAEPEFNFDADLAMFTNTTFFDFDLGHNADLQPDMHFDMKPQQIENTQNNNAGTPVDFSKTNMDFLQSQYTDFVTLFWFSGAKHIDTFRYHLQTSPHLHHLKMQNWRCRKVTTQTVSGLSPSECSESNLISYKMGCSMPLVISPLHLAIAGILRFLHSLIGCAFWGHDTHCRSLHGGLFTQNLLALLR